MKTKTRPTAPGGDHEVPIELVCSHRRALKACRELGVITVADFLRRDRSEFLAVRNFGPRTYQKLDAAVRRWLGNGAVEAGRHEPPDRRTAAAAPHDPTPRSLELMQLLQGLEPHQVELLRLRLGIGCKPLNVRELATQLACTPLEVRSQLSAGHHRVHDLGGPILEAVREEGRRWVESHDGLATPGQLAAGTVLRGAAVQDPFLPGRLLCFFYPDEFFALDQAITCTSLRAVGYARSALRRWRRQRRFPVALADLYRLLGSGERAVPWGVVRHLLQHLGLTVANDPVRGTVVKMRSDAVVDRVEDILREAGGPMAVEDLVFHYRDLYHSCHKGRLLEHLRADPRMLELGRDTWTLREHHRTELEAMSGEARELARRIHELGGRQDARQLAAERSLSETQLCLVLACLRQDPSLRDLGRAEFCPRNQKRSKIMQKICDDLRRAMGELPVWRFLENQKPSRRGVIERLLRDNRLFVEPRENRVDLLTNYPFSDERLRSLCDLVDRHLATRGNYAPLSEVLDAVQRTDMGGNYLTEHLLGDVLRRHGPFEILPGSVVARAEMGLGGWIQQKAREVLRHADLPLTPGEIVAEVPELGEFSACLQELLERDPLVVSNDAMHYRLV